MVAIRQSFALKFTSLVTLTTHIVRVARLVWACHPRLTLALLFMTILQSLLPATTAFVSKLIVDSVVRAVQQPAAGEQAWGAVLLALSMGALDVVIVMSAGLAQELLGNRLHYHINALIVSQAISLDLSFYENPQFYNMLHRAKAEAGYRPLRLITQLLTVAGAIITILSLLALLLRFSPGITGVLMVVALPSLFVQTRYGREAFRLLNKRAPEARQMDYYAQLLTSEPYAKEVKLFNLAPTFLSRYQALFAHFYSQDRQLALRRTGFMIGLALLSLLGYYGCYAYVIGRALGGLVTLGDLTLYGLVFQQLQRYLSSLLGALSSIYESTLFLSNLFGFLALRPSLALPAAGRRVPAHCQAGWILHNVSFCYPGTERYVLRHISLSIGSDEKIALVGENGAGKTTLIKLLTRLYDPTEGYITLDGIDLREYDLESLHRRISVIFQDFGRYHLSAWENIGLGQIERLDDRERIIQAAHKSGAHQVIARLPAGYETLLGRLFEGGCQLSLGEWQKVALARAFMRDAHLLILDEPTASMDASTEYQIFQQFSELAAGRAVVLISHRFSTVRMADRIVVLRQGRIVEQGSHTQLIEQQGLYARLFNMQAEPYVALYGSGPAHPPADG